MAARQRLDGADLLRAVAVIGVVAIHAVAWPNRGPASDAIFWTDTDLIVRFAVPVFVVMTGMLLAYTYPNRLVVGDFLKRRFSRSLIPWIFWAPVYCFIDWFITGELPHSTPLINWFTYGGGHLYYLILVPQFYFVFLLWPRSTKGMIIAATIALGLQEFLDIYRLYASIPGQNLASELLLWRAYTLFPFWIGYFGVGVLVGRLLHQRSAAQANLALLCVVLVPVTAWLVITFHNSGAPNAPRFTSGTSAFLLPLMPLFVFAVFGAGLWGGSAVFRASPRLQKVVSTVALYSLGIYITHEALLRIPAMGFHALLAQTLPWSAVGDALVIAVSLVLGLAATRIIVATPLAVTVGQKRLPFGAKKQPAEIRNSSASGLPATKAEE